MLTFFFLIAKKTQITLIHNFLFLQLRKVFRLKAANNDLVINWSSQLLLWNFVLVTSTSSSSHENISKPPTWLHICSKAK